MTCHIDVSSGPVPTGHLFESYELVTMGVGKEAVFPPCCRALVQQVLTALGMLMPKSQDQEVALPRGALFTMEQPYLHVVSGALMCGTINQQEPTLPCGAVDTTATGRDFGVPQER